MNFKKIFAVFSFKFFENEIFYGFEVFLGVISKPEQRKRASTELRLFIAFYT